MNDEKIEEILNRHDEKIERYMGALSEEFQSRLSVVAEGVIGLGEKVDLLNEKVDNLEVKVDNLASRMDIVENTLSEVVHTQKIHTEMIGELMESDSERKIELENKVDRTEFVELKQTVLAMS